MSHSVRKPVSPPPCTHQHVIKYASLSTRGGRVVDPAKDSTIKTGSESNLNKLSGTYLFLDICW